MDITTFAHQHNIDPSALAGLVDFLRRCMANPEFAEAMANTATRDAALTAAVKSYAEKSRAFYTEMLEGKTERAQQWRKQIAAETWQEIRRRQGMATV